jgi:uncharacterized protein (TIGR03435 family)
MMMEYLSPIANHLWQSTICAAVAVALALALSRNRAQARYWLWLVASVKFLVPFSLLVGVGGLLEWRTAPAVTPQLSSAVEQISRPFPATTIAPLPGSTSAAGATVLPAVLFAVWFCGFAAVVSIWWARWRRIRRTVRGASPLNLGAPVPVMSSPTLVEPGVFGVFRPVLLLPEGITDRLSPAQLEAILAHELCHVRRRDNLAAAIHMAVEAMFWFHPLVWWIGARLIEERERACDEEVVLMGNEPHSYAEGILNVCKFYLESPLACASGVTGSDLKKRIEAIMAGRVSHQLTFARKLLLAAAGMAALAGPVVVGIMSASHGRAQSHTGTGLTFEVASVKPADPQEQRVAIRIVPGGGLNLIGVSLKQMIAFAYNVRESQISGGPGWLNSERFDIIAKSPRSESPSDPRQMNADQRKVLENQLRERTQALLEERFQLRIDRETKELPVYALTVGKNGHKLKQSEAVGPGVRQHLSVGRGHLSANGVPLESLANGLANLVGRPVLDETGLPGNFDFTLEWTPDGGSLGPPPPGARPEASAPSDLSGPSIFTAVQEQLGLKLESKKGAVDVIVIGRAEKPSAN